MISELFSLLSARFARLPADDNVPYLVRNHQLVPLSLIPGEGIDITYTELGIVISLSEGGGEDPMALIPVNWSGATKTLISGDNSTYQRSTSTGGLAILTVPANSTQELPVGFFALVTRSTAGALSVVAEAGVTLNHRGYGGTALVQGESALLKKVGTNEWDVVSDSSKKRVLVLEETSTAGVRGFAKAPYDVVGASIPAALSLDGYQDEGLGEPGELLSALYDTGGNQFMIVLRGNYTSEWDGPIQELRIEDPNDPTMTSSQFDWGGSVSRTYSAGQDTTEVVWNVDPGWDEALLLDTAVVHTRKNNAWEP